MEKKEETMNDYMKSYLEFEKKFRLTEVSIKETSQLIMHQTGYFIRYNVRLGNALRNFSRVKATFQTQIDPATGKAMSSSKAQILANDTKEATDYEMARIHVNNIQEIINSTKVLQKGMTNEYALMQ